MPKEKKIIIINQAVNYLTVAICNEFVVKYDEVVLLTGSIHEQGEPLNSNVKVKYITKWKEEHGFKKALIYIKATLQIWWLLLIKYRKFEVFFISLPPMGYLINLLVTNKFSMLLWDIYPDVFKITGMKESHIVYKAWSFLNTKSFKKAYKIFTIGENVKQSLLAYSPNKNIMISHIWSIFQDNNKVLKEENPFIEEYNLKHKFIVQYSGNIGLTHNVEVLVDIASKMQEHTDILFQIIGRGPRKKVLEERVLKEDILNCQFLPFQSDEMFPYSLAAADVGVVILDERTSKGSVPSKSYNLMSYGIPSLYIASKDSELMNYAQKYKHANCYTKNDLEQIEAYILKLKTDNLFYNEYVSNSVNASKDFKRVNAQKLVENYTFVP